MRSRVGKCSTAHETGVIEGVRRCVTVSRLHKQQSAPGRNSVQPETSMNEKWRHHLRVYCVMCVTKLSFLLL